MNNIKKCRDRSMLQALTLKSMLQAKLELDRNSEGFSYSSFIANTVCVFKEYSLASRTGKNSAIIKPRATTHYRRHNVENIILQTRTYSYSHTEQITITRYGGRPS